MKIDFPCCPFCGKKTSLSCIYGFFVCYNQNCDMYTQRVIENLELFVQLASDE